MKKYLILAVLAVALFAGTAFAASLNVDGGVLQAGNDSDLTCATEAVVDYQTFSSAGSIVVDQVTVTFSGGDCDGLYAYLNLYDGPTDLKGFGIKTIAGGEAVYATSNIPVADINIVDVAVKSTDDSGVGCYAGTGMAYTCP